MTELYKSDQAHSSGVRVIEPIVLNGYLMRYFAAPVSGPRHECLIALS